MSETFVGLEPDPSGFFWYENGCYCVVILHKARRIQEGRRKVKFCKEFRAYTPEALIKLCRIGVAGIGYKIGSPKQVDRLCWSVPRSWTSMPRSRRPSRLGKKLPLRETYTKERA